MKRWIALLFATLPFIVVAPACSVVGSEGEVRVMPAVDFDVVERSALSVEIEVTGTWRNTCGLFSRFETTAQDSTYIIEMLGRAPRNVICEQKLTEVSSVWSETMPGPGAYRFQFSRESQRPLDTLMVFRAP